MPSSLYLEDAREYIFPIFSVETEGDGIYLESRIFLGTGFFVTKRGDAVSAGHVLLAPNELPADRRLIAIVQCDGEATPCWITKAAKLESFDVALLHVNLKATKYLPLSAQGIMPGTDVQLVGIPSNDINHDGKEMRILKGHVTLSGKRLELNFPVPSGMSGSPVFVGPKVVGYATGQVRSEELEEATETINKLTNEKEIIYITEIRRITSYGIAYAFSAFQNLRDPVLDNKTLLEFVASQNQ